MHIDPERSQFETFKALPRDMPVNMLNLIKLRAEAAYADGRAATGHDAYSAYGRESTPIFRAVGGQIIWRGAPEAVLIGPEDEDWDLAFIAGYPSVGAFLAMVTDPAYQAIVHHRRAGVSNSRLIAMAELPTSEGFG